MADGGRVARGHHDLHRQQTPAQTLGPFFHPGLVPGWPAPVAGVSLGRAPFGSRLAGELTRGERVRIEGQVYDGAGDPVNDALVEIWQANADGRYAHPLDTSERPLDPHFWGFGRVATDERGGYAFDTIKPGRVPGLGGELQAAHVNVIVGARGLSRLAFTRLYFEGDGELSADPVLRRVPEARRSTLLARALGQVGGARLYRFDIHLQGERECVFFEF